MSRKLILSLNDRYAAITVAAALLEDRLQTEGAKLPPDALDKLTYLRDVLLEFQAEIALEINTNANTTTNPTNNPAPSIVISG